MYVDAEPEVIVETVYVDREVPHWDPTGRHICGIHACYSGPESEAEKVVAPIRKAGTVINDGIVQQVGSPMELYDQPSNLFVAGFLGVANVVELLSCSRLVLCSWSMGSWPPSMARLISVIKRDVSSGSCQ